MRAKIFVYLFSCSSHDLEGARDEWVKAEKAGQLMSTRQSLLIGKYIYSRYKVKILSLSSDTFNKQKY